MIQALMRVIFFFSDFFEFVIKQKCLGSQCIFLPYSIVLHFREVVVVVVVVVVVWNDEEEERRRRKERTRGKPHAS